MDEECEWWRKEAGEKVTTPLLPPPAPYDGLAMVLQWPCMGWIDLLGGPRGLDGVVTRTLPSFAISLHGNCIHHVFFTRPMMYCSTPFIISDKLFFSLTIFPLFTPLAIIHTLLITFFYTFCTFSNIKETSVSLSLINANCLQNHSEKTKCYIAF